MKPLLIAILFSSCTNFSSNNIAEQSSGKIATSAIDTANTKAYAVTTQPEIFETAFFIGTRAKLDTFAINFYPVNIGQINIESGKIIACDPIVMYDAHPFSQTFPIGRFPVQLAIAKFSDDERVAFSRILFSNKPVVKWEFALHEGQKAIPIGGDEFYGYGVDGGIGLFIDQAANSAYDELSRSNEKLFTEVFTTEMLKHHHSSWEYILYQFGEHNLASFTTGFGDGTYATYVGYDKDGKICRLLTDFNLVEWWKRK